MTQRTRTARHPAQRAAAVRPTCDPPVEALRCLVAAMGWTLEEVDSGFTLTMPDGQAASSHADACSALAHLAYVATWRKDREDVRVRVAWLGPASDELEGPRGDALRWLAQT